MLLPSKNNRFNILWYIQPPCSERRQLWKTIVEGKAVRPQILDKIVCWRMFCKEPIYGYYWQICPGLDPCQQQLPSSFHASRNRHLFFLSPYARLIWFSSSVCTMNFSWIYIASLTQIGLAKRSTNSVMKRWLPCNHSLSTSLLFNPRSRFSAVCPLQPRRCQVYLRWPYHPKTIVQEDSLTLVKVFSPVYGYVGLFFY